MNLDPDNRFQDQPWHIKLWRYRYYLLVPFMVGKLYYRELTLPGLRYRATFKQIWGLAIAEQHIKMNWFYDMGDMKKRMDSLDLPEVDLDSEENVSK